MKEIRFTLIADGSSDKTLLKVIKWLLDDLYPTIPTLGTFADFRNLPRPPKTLSDKIHTAEYYYPSDILFIHRDAESTDIKTLMQRFTEIRNNIEERYLNSIICIVPMKMMETWLLINAEAIKKAAGNRNYSGRIILPPAKSLESESQPKKRLHELLEQASGLKGRNLEKFNVDRAVHLVAENITDFSLLRKLKAFQLFEKNLVTTFSLHLQQQPLVKKDENHSETQIS
jgi:hypothetical protein